MLRVIREVQPLWIVGENVLGLVNWSGGLVFEEVQADLEAKGYEVQAYVLPAAAVNAPHRRDRVWFVAYRNSNGQHERNGFDEINASEGRQYAQRDTNESHEHGDAADTGSIRQECWEKRECSKGWTQSYDKQFEGYGKFYRTNFEMFPTQSPICSRNDGIPDRLDSITFSKWRNESIKAAGNAVVPQVVFEIFKAIEKYENKFG